VSQDAPEGFYVYQLHPPRPDGRIYSVGGFESFDVVMKRLTRAEADAIAACMNALQQPSSPRPSDEAQNG
jgi:hypothetical protein